MYFFFNQVFVVWKKNSQEDLYLFKEAKIVKMSIFIYTCTCINKSA